MGHTILGSLFLFLVWFIFGMKTKKYAPPTNSVFLIGLIVSILGWVFYHEDVSGWYWFAMICAYGLLTLVFRTLVEKQGMFWRVSRLHFDWSHKTLFKHFETSEFIPWPRWKFGYIATDAVRPPQQFKDAEDFFCWEGTGGYWKEDIGGKFRCTVTIKYAFKAEATLENTLALIAFEDGVPKNEKGRYKKYLLEEKIGEFLKSSLHDRIIASAEEAASAFSCGTDRKIIIKEHLAPVEKIVPGLSQHYNSSISVKYDLLQIA